nr:TMEM165/GDT1 family protein [Aquabacterium terrae]
MLASFSLVALAEIGDKTQLLSFMLAARFKGRQAALILGILVATLANHAMAAWLGDGVAAHVGPQVMRWVLASAFLAFAGWALIPDKPGVQPSGSRHGPFVTSAVAFFIAEIGDKTQFATIALGAQYPSLGAVVLGTTLGMMVANVPAVLLGERLAHRVPLGAMRYVAAALFAGFGVLVLFGL